MSYVAHLSTGDIKVIQGQGMPSHRHHDHGNLYVKLNIKFPDSLTPDQLTGLEKALPARRKLNKISSKVFQEEVHLTEPSEREKQGAASDGMDEDEDDERGGPGVQCAQRESRGICLLFSFLNRLPMFAPQFPPQSKRIMHEHFYDHDPVFYHSIPPCYSTSLATLHIDISEPFFHKGTLIPVQEICLHF
jgi:hypothetical protein